MCSYARADARREKHVCASVHPRKNQAPSTATTVYVSKLAATERCSICETNRCRTTSTGITHTRAREGIKTAAHARARHQSLARPRSLAPILATTPSPSLPATPKNSNVLQRLVRRCCLRARGNNALTRERCAPQGRHPPCLWGEPSAKPPAPVGR